MLRNLTWVTLSVSLILLVGTVSCQDADLPAEVVWLEGQTWSEITALAGQEDKPILIDFYATWCGPCKMLDKEVYTVPEVISDLARLITFKVDVDKPEYEELTDVFHIFNMPTLVLCNPDGSEIDRFIGFRPADEFRATIADYLAGKGTLADVEKRLAASPDDPELLLAAGTKRAQRLDAAAARPLLEKALAGDEQDELQVASAALWELASLEWKLENYDVSIATFERLLANYSAAMEPEAVLGMIAYVQKRQGDTEGMVATHREIMRRNPDDVGAMNGFAWNAAQAGLALEEATDIAHKAVRLSDEDPGIMDTLAEVYFARGQYEEAVSWIKRAIAKEPDDQYFQDQLARFERAAQEGQP